MNIDKDHLEHSFWGSVSEEDKVGIVEVVKKVAPYSGPIVEIGALFGLTTQLIAVHKPREKELIAVDDFSWNPFGISRDDHKEFTERVLLYCTEYCHTRIFDGTNRQFHETYRGETPAMIFIDAEHTYKAVMEDIEWSLRMGIPVISGHDYCELFPGVVRAVDESFSKDITLSGSVWSVTNW